MPFAKRAVGPLRASVFKRQNSFLAAPSSIDTQTRMTICCTTRARALLAGAIVAVGLAACASAPIEVRARAITAADRDAKQAVAAESQIDPARIPARSLSVLPFAVA